MKDMSEKLMEDAGAAFEEWYSQGLTKKEAIQCFIKNHHGIYTLMKVYTDHIAFVAGYLARNKELNCAIEQAFMDGQADAGIDPSFSSAKEYANKILRK